MEMASTEDSQQLTDHPIETDHQQCDNHPIETDHQQHDNSLPDAIHIGGLDQKQEIDLEEVRHSLEAIASTGKCWHDWKTLKSMLSFQLKQVLSEYSEANMTSEQQNASLGESYSQLVRRLDEAVASFVEGPPFTIQRICEILLDARNIYPSLSKLALALEKNLLVTLTLAICNDPYAAPVTQKPDEQEKEVEEPKMHSNSAENGNEPIEGDGDEVMAEVEEADINNDEMTVDTVALEELAEPLETNSAAAPPSNS